MSSTSAGGRSPGFDRRRFLKGSLGAAAAGAAAPLLGRSLLGPAAAATGPVALRRPGSLPYPTRPPGQRTGAFYFDHVVVVMQENHSFDNYLGMLPVSGQPLADGFRFNRSEEPVDWNPVGRERMYVYHQSGEDGATDSGSQTWADTHRQIAGGAMNGFAATGPGSMGYYTEDDLPFYYSLARTFTLANRWFCSAPAQTYPNRRFLMAGTASGIISTDLSNVGVQPANGTIWDRLSSYGIGWKNYFTDAPSTAIIASTVADHAVNLAPIEEFYLDAAAGTLPAVSLVDSDFGTVTGQVAGIPGLLPVKVPVFGSALSTTAESEENPQNVQLGEAFVARIVSAVMASPAWRRTLLVWTYDEHGGYYDHVAPPPAVAPDAIAPMLAPTDPPGGYDIYGPRVPTVVVSPYSRPRAVTGVVHDHTSILATVEAQWNLPALTWRDANAATVADFLADTMTFPEPPALAPPANPLPGLLAGFAGQPAPPTPASTVPPGGTA